MLRSVTDSEASPDRPATSLSGAMSARQKGHAKSASTSHTLQLDLPSTSATSAAASNATTTIEDLIRYVCILICVSHCFTGHGC